MKASELIKRLQELVEEHGDHDVEIESLDGKFIDFIPPDKEYPWLLITQKPIEYHD